MDKKIIKEDINFLEHPMWIVSEKHKIYKLSIQKNKGLYEKYYDEWIDTVSIFVYFRYFSVPDIATSVNAYVISMP
jgi:hypothetical protein